MTNKPAPAERVYLAVPFKEKDAAKELGALWNRENKQWFVNLDPGAGLGALERCRPAPDTLVETPEAAFGAAPAPQWGWPSCDGRCPAPRACSR